MSSPIADVRQFTCDIEASIRFAWASGANHTDFYRSACPIASTFFTYASMSNFRSSPAAFMYRTVPKIFRSCPKAGHGARISTRRSHTKFGSRPQMKYLLFRYSRSSNAS